MYLYFTHGPSVDDEPGGIVKQTLRRSMMATKAKTAAVKVDTKQFDEAVAVGKETVEKTVAATKEQVDQAVAVAKEQVEKASDAAIKGYDEVTMINKSAFDAIAKSSDVLVKGSEDLGKAYYAFFQAAADAQVEAAKSMMTAKSINEVVEIQSAYARTAFDKAVSEGSKLSEMGVKVATDAFEPIQSQVNVAFDRAMKPLAA